MADDLFAAVDLDRHRSNRPVLGDPLEGELVRRVGWNLDGELERFAAVGVENIEPVEERDVPVVAREVDPRMGGGRGVDEFLLR